MMSREAESDATSGLSVLGSVRRLYASRPPGRPVNSGTVRSSSSPRPCEEAATARSTNTAVASVQRYTKRSCPFRALVYRITERSDIDESTQNEQYFS